MRFLPYQLRFSFRWVVVGLLCLTLGCSQAREVPEPEVEEEPLEEETIPVAKEEISAFALASYADDGSKQWEVKGQSADILLELIELNQVNADAFGEKVDVNLTAREGTYNRKTQDVYLEHDVEVNTSNGTRLRTDTLDWNAHDQLASTEDWATVDRERIQVTGKGMTGQPGLKQVRFKRNVRVDLEPNTVITCRSTLDVDYRRSRARFWRRVHVRDERGDIWADRMDVWMDPETEELKEVRCWGHVVIEQGPQVAKAHRAVYRQPEGKIILMGHPNIRYYPEGTQGESERSSS